MSGEATGALAIPLAIAAAPFVLAGVVVAQTARLAARGVQAAAEYERQKRAVRREIRESGIRSSIGDFRAEIRSTMAEQTRRNREASEQMLREMDRQREAMEKAAARDPALFRDYLARMSEGSRETMQRIMDAQRQFSEGYDAAIRSSMDAVSHRLNDQYDRSMRALSEMAEDQAAQEERSAALAEDYLTEARTLLASLKEQFEGERFLPRELLLLQEQLREAEDLVRSGQYASVAIAARDLICSALEAIYRADEKKQEWDNCYKMAYVLCEQLKEAAESMETVSLEAKQQAEALSGKELSDELVGLSVAEYTPLLENGQNSFAYYQNLIREAGERLRVSGEQMSTEELRNLFTQLNEQVYPALTRSVNRGIFNLSNALIRRDSGERIMDYFEGKDFVCVGWAYDEMDDSALHMAFQNSLTDELLTVTLAPEWNGDEVNTGIRMDQLAGDALNEERRAELRQGVEAALRAENPYARVALSCTEDSRNLLSQNSRALRRIQEQQQQQS